MNIDHNIQRLSMLSTLQADHDGEGALASNPYTYELASRFVETLRYRSIDADTIMVTGGTYDGNAVIEFHGPGQQFSSVEFLADEKVEAYRRLSELSSLMITPRYDSPELFEFLMIGDMTPAP